MFDLSGFVGKRFQIAYYVYGRQRVARGILVSLESDVILLENRLGATTIPINCIKKSELIEEVELK